MQLERKQSKIQLTANPVLAAFLAFSLLFLSSLAASPTLHRSLHADANAPGHTCVITLFAKGQINSVPLLPALAAFAVLFAGIVLLTETFTISQADYRFSSSRAPPRFS